MDRQQVLNYLEAAERHVAEGEALVTRQRNLLEDLRGQGRDLGSARDLLGRLEQAQAQQIADRDRLRALLAELRTPDPPEV
jgi:hypothetical protein